MSFKWFDDYFLTNMFICPKLLCLSIWICGLLENIINMSAHLFISFFIMHNMSNFHINVKLCFNLVFVTNYLFFKSKRMFLKCLNALFLIKTSQNQIWFKNQKNLLFHIFPAKSNRSPTPQDRLIFLHNVTFIETCWLNRSPCWPDRSILEKYNFKNLKTLLSSIASLTFPSVPSSTSVQTY